MKFDSSDGMKSSQRRSMISIPLAKHYKVLLAKAGSLSSAHRKLSTARTPPAIISCELRKQSSAAQNDAKRDSKSTGAIHECPYLMIAISAQTVSRRK